MITSTASKFIFLTLIIVSAVLVRMINIEKPLFDTHYFRQAQTATVVKNFYIEGINLFQSRIDILGLGREQNLLLEFPLYQGIVASLYKLFGFKEAIGKLTSVFFGITGGLVLYKLARGIFPDFRISLLSLTIFLFLPLNIFFQQAFMIESLVIFLHLISLYSVYLFITGTNKGWLFSVFIMIFTSLALITKVIYAPFLLLQILGLILILQKKYKLHVKHLLFLLIPALVMIVWQKYVDHFNALNGNIYHTSGSLGQILWNFGSLQERFSYRAWGFRTLQIIKSLTVFILPLFGLGIIKILRNRSDRISKFLLFWFLSYVLYFLIFFGIQTHNYYFLPVLPLISIISSIGYVELINYRSSNMWKMFTLSYFAAFLIYAVFSSLPLFKLDSEVENDISFVKSNLEETGNLIFVFKQKDWNSAYTYYTGRKGTVFGIEGINKKVIDSILGENYVYMAVFDIPQISDDNNLRFLRENYALEARNDRVEIFKL